MKTLESLTKSELSLLLYFESRAVDHSGRVDSRNLNDTDRGIASRWNDEGFVGYGRIASEHISPSGAHWCSLSEAAWKLAHEARKARADRMWSKRNYSTTAEKRAA